MYDLYDPYDDERTQSAMDQLAGMPSSIDQPPMPTPQGYDMTPPVPSDMEAPAPTPQQTPVDDDPLAQMAKDYAHPTVEQQPQQQGYQGSSFGPLGNGVGWAALADLMLNKGRGLGSIVAGGAGIEQAKAQQYAAQQRQQKKDALEEEFKRAQIGKMSGDADLEKDQHALTRESQRLRGLEIDEQTSELKYRQEKDAAAREGHKDADGNPLPALTEDEYRARRAQGEADELAQKAKLTGDELQQKRTLTEEEMASREKIAGMRGSRGAAGGGGGYGDEITAGEKRKLDENQKQADRAARTTPIPGTEVADAPGWDAASQTPAARGQVANVVNSYKEVSQAIDRMIDIRKRAGVELVGKDKTDYDTAQTQAIAGYTKLGNSGMLNGHEYERYKDMVPSITPGWTDALDFMGSAVGHGGDTVLEKLQGLKQGTESAIDTSLGTYGLRRSSSFAAPLGAPKSVATGAPNAAPPAGDVLPVTNQKRSQIPKVSDVLKSDDDDEFQQFGAVRVR